MIEMTLPSDTGFKIRALAVRGRLSKQATGITEPVLYVISLRLVFRYQTDIQWYVFLDKSQHP